MSKKLKGRTIVLGITGSIAAYKAAELTSQLVKLDADVHVVMTRGATEFIAPLTLQTLSRNPVGVDLWEEGKGWQPGHIELADKADLLVVAPATANVIGCFAHGLAPDLLTSIYLATRAVVVVAPAMNTKMLKHAATQKNLRILRERGDTVLDTGQGLLACGYEGKGKLRSVENLVEVVVKAL